MLICWLSAGGNETMPFLVDDAFFVHTQISDMQNRKLFSINFRLHKYVQCYIAHIFIFAVAGEATIEISAGSPSVCRMNVRAQGSRIKCDIAQKRGKKYCGWKYGRANLKDKRHEQKTLQASLVVLWKKTFRILPLHQQLWIINEDQKTWFGVKLIWFLWGGN